MNKTLEMSKTTQERIENVFNEFVVNKIVDELLPIKRDLNRSDKSYGEKTTRECIENIYRSVGEMEDSVNKIKKSVLHQDSNWKMSEQIQSLVDSQEDITDDIESVNKNLSNIKSDVSAQISTTNSDINKSIEKAFNALAAHSDTANENAANIKDDISKTSETTVKLITKSFERVETTTTQNTSELKNHINDVMAACEEKIANINASNIKNISLMLKILIGISSINTIGIITAIVMNLNF